jgi:leucyl/phenylalanyl-tRNA--protein transferase
MSRSDHASLEITPEMLLRAYACGIFPMAESAEDVTLHWVEPQRRGIIPLEGFHISRRLARTVRSDRFDIRVDHDFDAVIDACASPAEGREKTWINGRIRSLFRRLFEMGHCHTVEAWRDGALAGGLYGLRLGRAFFGESMFHRERDASKVALVNLVARLRAGGFQLLDTQFLTGHLESFGAVEVSRKAYAGLLSAAVGQPATFPPGPMSGADAVRLATGAPATGP